MLPVLSPAIVSTVPAKTYDKLWVEEIIISAGTLGGEATARVRLKNLEYLMVWQNICPAIMELG